MTGGYVSYDPPDANGNFTLILHGLYDANGNRNPNVPGHSPLPANRLGDLTFDAPVHYDGIPELPERIEVNITGVWGNEAHVDPDKSKATGMISDDSTKRDGPVLTLHSPVTTTESGSPDPWNATADKTDWHRIDLHVAAPDPIRTVITLNGKNTSSVRYDGTNESSADFKWAGEVEYSLDNGASWQAMPATNYSYDASTGTCELTIPVNATNVRFGVTAIDDLRETGDAVDEGYTVTLELKDAGGGATDAGAVLHDNGNTKQPSLTNTTGITPDMRPPGTGQDHMNPSDFDGPFVVIEPGTTNPVAETGGSLPYSVKLKNPNGSGALFGDTTENVEVTLTVGGSDGFQIQDLFAPDSNGVCNGTITYQAYDALGNPVGPSQTVPVSENGTGTSFSFTTTLPPGAAEIKIQIPVHDDPLGGASSGTSAIERLEETVTVRITDVKGNETRVDGNDAASVTIRDDTLPADFDGVKVGLSWDNDTSTDTAKTVEEGKTGIIMLRLFDNAGGNLTGSPYLNYQGDHTLPENLAVKLFFTNTAGSDADMALQFSSVFLALVDDGKVTVTIGNTIHTNSAGLNGLDIQGEFTVTLIQDKFDFSSDLGSLSFNAHTFGDNVQEYKDDPGGYGTETNEQFGLKVTGVSGNESSIKTGADTATGTITDRPDGTLSIEGGSLHESSGNSPGWWDFKIAVKYTDNEKTNHPGAGQAVNPGLEYGGAGDIVKVPGEGTTITIRFTDTGVMEHDAEYIVTAYDLFLSVNKPAANHITEAEYDDILAGNTAADASWIIVRQSPAGWVDNGSGKDTTTFDLEVPKEYWTTTGQAQNGTIDFAITQGPQAGAISGTNTGGFVVSIEQPADGRGEITGLGTSSSVAAKEDTTLSIEMTLAVDREVFENPDGGTQSNIATFAINFAQMRNGVPINTDFEAGRDFSFQFTLRGSLNENTADNTLYPDLGDFALCDEHGNISIYDGLAGADGLVAKLQAILTDLYGTQEGTGLPNVSIELDTSADPGITRFTVKISEGTDLSEGIEFKFIAQDNNTTDAARTIEGFITNPRTVENSVDIKITKDGGTTAVKDESVNPSGFAIAVGDGYGYEKTVGASALDGNGNPLDGKVHVPVYAYILSNGNMPGSSVADGEILSYTELYAIYTAKNTSQSFSDFITANFGPKQDITITLKLGEAGDNGVVTEDYKDKGAETLSPGPGWVLVVDPVNDKVYFENECTVETIDDKFSTEKGSAIDLTVTVTDSAGNESRPVETGPGGRDSGKLATGHDAAATGEILDYHGGPYIKQLGPADGFIYEPIDSSHGQLPHEPGEQHVAAPKATSYVILLNDAATETMVVWLDIKGNGQNPGNDGAVYGEDYVFGKGLYQFAGGKYLRFNPDGSTTELTQAEIDGLPTHLDSSQASLDGKYFVIIEGPTSSQDGKSSAGFDILVKDDNKTEDNDFLEIKVVDVQGGEATYTETINTGSGDEVFTIPWAKDVPYEYFVNGQRVLVDPAHNCYTTIPGGVKTTWTEASKPAWALKPGEAGYAPADPDKVSAIHDELQIKDDGQGPVVSLVGGANKVDWIDGEEAPVITVTMQDYCQEDVTITLRLGISGQGEYSLTLSMPKGQLTHTFTAQEINEAWHAKTGSYLTSGDKKSFDVQITNSERGETDHSDNTIRVIFHDGSMAIKLHDLQPMEITEGWRPGIDGAVSGDGITLKMYIPGDSASGDNFAINGEVAFTIRVTPSGNLSADTAELYRVTLSQAQLLELQDAAGKDYTVKIVMNGATPEVSFYAPNSSVAHTFTSGNPTVSLTGGTSLPKASGDAVIGDNYGVGMAISGVNKDPNGDGGEVSIYYDSGSLSHVGIKDGTFARLLIFVEDGPNVWKLVDESTLKENAGTLNMKAALVLVDADGDLVDASGMKISGSNITLDDLVTVKTETALEFDIDFGDYTGLSSIDRNAAEGSDYTGSGKVRIEANGTEGTFTITVTNDDFTEGREGLNLSLKATQETQDSSGPALSHIVDETGTPVPPAGAYGSANVIIEDDGSGPVIYWNLSDTSVKENGQLSLSWDSYARNADGTAAGREIVKEDVAMEFEIMPNGDFTLDEIASITVTVMDGGVPVAKTYIKGVDAEFDTLITGGNNGPWTLRPTFIGGTGLGSLTINFQDDVISDPNESFTIELKKVTGSEAHIGKDGGDTGTPISETVTIEETLDGPKVNLAANSASEESGEAVYTLKLADGQAIGEDATVTIKLTPEALAMLDTGGTVTISGPAGTGNVAASISQPDASGTCVITIPRGVANGDYAITFPITDDSLAAERTFGVELGALNKGELRYADQARYQVEFVNETGGDTSNGGTKTLNIFTTDSVVNTEGKIAYNISGITNPDVIQKIVVNLDGTEVTLTRGYASPPGAGEWFWNSTTQQIETVSKSRAVCSSYEITVTFAKAGGTVTEKDLSDSKMNMAVENPHIEGTVVSVPVKNETDPSRLDGPRVGVAFDAGPFTEDGDITGSVTVNLVSAAANGDTVTLDDIVITLNITPAGAAFAADGTSDLDPSWITRSGDTVTITIPQGTAIPGGGKFDLGFEIPVPDNSLAADNPDYKVTVTGVRGADANTPVYETYEKDPANAAAVTRPGNEADPAELDGPVVSLESTTPATFEEGGDITGKITVDLASAVANGDTVTLDDIVIALNVSPTDAPFSLVNPPPGCIVTQQPDGTVTITVKAGTNISECANIEFAIPVPDDSFATNPGYTVTLENVAGSGNAATAYERYEKTTDTGKTAFTVNPENDGAHLEGPVVSVENTTTGTPVEGATDGTGDITGKIKVALSHAAASEGGNTLDDIVITLQIAPREAASDLAIDGAPPWCSVGAPDADGYVTVTIHAGTPLSDCSEIGFRLPVADNSLAINPDYKITITDVTGAGGTKNVYETYEVDTANADTGIIATANDGLSLPGPTASFDPASGGDIMEGGDIAGKILVDMRHLPADGDKTHGETVLTLTIATSETDFDLSQVTFAPDSSWDGLYTVDTSGLPAVTITIPDGTAIPPGGFELGFTFAVPLGSVGGTEDAGYALSLGITATAYENADAAMATADGIIANNTAFRLPLSAHGLFEENGTALDEALESGLANLADFDKTANDPPASEGAPAYPVGAEVTEPASAAWEPHVVDPGPAHDEQALLIMKIMTESGSA